MKSINLHIISKILLLSFASFIIMFGLSYFWHGIFFNDFDRQYLESSFSGKEGFYAVIAGKYFLLALLLGCGYAFFSIPKSPVLSGLIIGIVSSIFFIIPLLIDYKNNANFNSTHFSVDVLWQLFEQSAGGIVVALIDSFFFQKKMMLV